jgi:chemotaxis family two-component system sensor kinase Cph1
VTEGSAFRVSRAGAFDHMNRAAGVPPVGATVVVADDRAQVSQFRGGEVGVPPSLPIFEPASSAQALSADERISKLAIDLTACDREPIHVPGSIQPHGLLLIADAETLTVVAGAGDIEDRLSADWLGRQLDALIGGDANLLLPFDDVAARRGTQVRGTSDTFDVSIQLVGGLILAELEPAPAMIAPSATVLAMLDRAGATFGRAPNLTALCQDAAVLFREATGFDRVMIYRFLDSGAGCVVAEAQAPHLHSFLNHHFPATDIPQQARALYVRNRVRVIPDVAYEPAPLRPTLPGGTNVDMSDVALRSVSPIHIQYLKNMSVAASASVSIVKDGALWGLVACHHFSLRSLTSDVRAFCLALASSVARHVRAKEEAENYRERLRLRSAEDTVVAYHGRDGFLDQPDAQTRNDMRLMLGAEGFAAVRGNRVETAGVCPTGDQVLSLAQWLAARPMEEPYRTSKAPEVFPPAAGFANLAAGVLAVTISLEEQSFFIWFRAEHVQLIEWAGNPHKHTADDATAELSPRKSFETWMEAVRGQSRPWTLAEVEAAHRLRNAVYDSRQTRRLKEVNKELAATLADKESLLQLKEYLVKEVNHRVQNSLQLVSSFLHLQARSADNPAVTLQLEEAQRRLSAVALVHKRLYRDDNFKVIDLGRYLDELCSDVRESMDAEWKTHFATHFSPVLISTDRALNVGLVLTELIINANKYAYSGQPGPLSITLEQRAKLFHLVVSDRGLADHKAGQGFGTRMIKAMVERLAGTIEYSDNQPGLRVVFTAPVEEALH